MAKESGAAIAEKMREISIILDTYDDIFSDFDPRPYEKRTMSEDFLKEIQRRYLEDKHGRFEVTFTIPVSERDAQEEVLIKRRLREHFAIMVRREQETINRIKTTGYLYIFLGFIVLLANTAFFIALENSSVIYQILSILLVPAGWYGMFTGIGKVLDEPFESVERKRAFEKFERANYIFMSDDRE